MIDNNKLLDIIKKDPANIIDIPEEYRSYERNLRRRRF